MSSLFCLRSQKRICVFDYTAYLGQRFRAGVQFASMDVKFCPFVPEPPCVQEVAVVFNPALDTRVLQHLTWGTLWIRFLLCLNYFTF